MSSIIQYLIWLAFYVMVSPSDTVLIFLITVSSLMNLDWLMETCIL